MPSEKKASNYPTISNEAIQAIVFGYHGDPFAILGPHIVDDGLVIRVFLPQAVEIELQSDALTASMHKVHPDGFYELLVPGEKLPFTYQIKFKNQAGDIQQIEDPYRFPTLMSDFDEYLIAEGTHLHVYDNLGSHIREVNGVKGVLFAVWAPSALRVSVIGNFNNWDGRRNPMRFHHNSGVWELFIPNLGEGEVYKYEVKTRYYEYMVAKTDPVGFASEMRPKTASVVWDIDKYDWQDDKWLANRAEYNGYNKPMSIYEVHLSSWKKKEGDLGWEWLTYRELVDELIPYVKEMGYTHIELLPISEHPFDGSWGYQVTGYFAPTSRFGTPDDFMYFVDQCHQNDIGVILDWVPAHFPTDEHGLSFFDGTHLYEHEDPRKGAHPDWGTLIFNFGRYEVRQFLVSNAIFWIDKYHIDGLRVDAVASMLYLDFSREAGEWVPNRYGGRENIDAIEFLRTFNDRVHELFPGVLTIAEESTSWPGVTKPTSDYGLGFDFKWNMGWMHDMLDYMKKDPVYRSHHQGEVTFSLLYAFSERFMLPFSHDEVVHLKRSMVDKMPGDLWQKFANLRLLYAYQWAHPGKKLLFMGCEIGQWQEWSEERSLDWHLLEDGELHVGVQKCLTDLNHLYRNEPALYEEDNSWDGFRWVDLHDAQRSILAFARMAPSTGETIYVVANFTPIVRSGYRLGVAEEGQYEEVMNSDSNVYGGGNVINEGVFDSQPVNWHEQVHSIEITLPPLGVVYIKKKS